MARINALQQGIMGAIVGGLQFKLSQQLEQMRLDAELAKEQRLQAIQREQATFEFGQRKEILDLENQNAIKRDELNFNQQLRLTGTEQNFRATEAEKNRSHDLTLEDVRTNRDLTLEGVRTNNNIKQTDAAARINTREDIRKSVFVDEYQRQRGPKPGDAQGVYGSDGKFYSAGSPMPQGVSPTVGFGATNLGVRGTPASQRTHRGQATTPGVGAPSAAAPASQFNAPQGAVEMLKSNPALRSQFDLKYGQGASAFYLGE